MTSLMTLQPGTRGFLKLGENFSDPQWREAMVVGVQNPWIQSLVRCTAEEISKTGLSHVEHQGVTFCLVESEFSNLVGGCPEAAMMLDTDLKALMKLGVTVVQSDEDLTYATAAEPRAAGVGKARPRKTQIAPSEQTEDSSEEEGMDAMSKLKKSWLGFGMGDEKTEEHSGLVPDRRHQKRFALLDKESKNRGSKSSSSQLQEQALQVAMKSEDPLKGLLALQIMNMEKKKKGKQRKHKSETSSSSSGSDTSSEDDDTNKLLKGHSKAVHNYQLSGKKMFAQPLKYVKKYVKDLERELGAQDRPFRVVDQNRRIAFGRQRNLQRCHYLMGLVLELLLKNKPEKAALQCTLALQAMHQAALDQGEWTVAWLITHQEDPFSKKQLGGDPGVLQHVTTYLKSMHELQQSTESIRKKGGGKGNADDAGDQNQNKEGKGKGRRGKGTKEKTVDKDNTES